MKAFRCLFIVVSLAVVCSGCSTPVYRVAYVRSVQTPIKNEIIVVNATGDLIDIQEGGRIHSSGIEPYGTFSLICDIPFPYGNVDFPIIVTVYRMEDNKKIVLGQILKTFHFYGGGCYGKNQERFSWEISARRSYYSGVSYSERVIR